LTSGFDRAQAQYDAAEPADPVPCDDGHHSLGLGSQMQSVEFDGDHDISVVCVDCGASAIFARSGEWEL